VPGIKFRCCRGLIDEFTKCIDLGSEAIESVPTNADSARSRVSRLPL
jgi:hypothetical protein